MVVVLQKKTPSSTLGLPFISLLILPNMFFCQSTRDVYKGGRAVLETLEKSIH